MMNSTTNHVSLDFWNTLFASNPEFNSRRIDYLCKHFDTLYPEQVGEEINRIGNYTDQYNESNLESRTIDWMYSELFDHLGLHHIPHDSLKIHQKNIDNLCIEYAPICLCDLNQLRRTLGEIKMKGVTLNISSNTGYIGGAVLSKVLQKYNLFELFDFLIFSDLEGVSKPHPQFFQRVLENAKKFQSSNLNVLHMGDNSKADIDGAINYGFQAELIQSSPHSCLERLQSLYTSL